MSSKQCRNLEDLFKEVTLKQDDTISKATIKSIFRGCKDRNRKNGVEAPRILAQMTLGRVKQQQKLKNKLIEKRRNITKEDDSESVEEIDVLAWKKFMASKEIDEVDLLNKCIKILYLNQRNDNVTVLQKLSDGSIQKTNTTLVPLDTVIEPYFDTIQKIMEIKEVDEVDLTGKCKKIVYLNQRNDNITVVQKLQDGSIQRTNTSLVQLGTNKVESYLDKMQKFMAKKEVDEIDLTGKCKKIVYLNQRNDNITVVQKLQDGSIQTTNTTLVQLGTNKLVCIAGQKYQQMVKRRKSNVGNHRDIQWKIKQTLWKASKLLQNDETDTVSRKRKINKKYDDESKRQKMQESGDSYGRKNVITTRQI